MKRWREHDIRDLRRIYGISQERMAEILSTHTGFDLTASQISHWEAGARDITNGWEKALTECFLTDFVELERPVTVPDRPERVRSQHSASETPSGQEQELKDAIDEAVEAETGAVVDMVKAKVESDLDDGPALSFEASVPLDEEELDDEPLLKEEPNV